jgi:mono/diheme cytochrome c family protein
MRARGPAKLARLSAPQGSSQQPGLPPAYRSAGRALWRRWATAVAAVIAVLLGGCADGRPSERLLPKVGRRVFVSSGCGGCHTIAAVHTHGQVGPDFDTSEQLNRDQIRAELDDGDGVMPSYRKRLTAGQLDAVIEFVFRTLHDRR